MQAVKIQNLTKQYGHITAIDDLSVDIEADRIFGFLGPDGAGKTSLFRILCGILTATQGLVSVFGTDVLKKPEKVKQELGYMAQKFALYGDLTVKENLDFFADLFKTPSRGLTERKLELLRFANLDRFLDRLAGNLSGGMKQKLALCCTLIHTPRILILDEPTTGVDPVSRQEFWDMLLPLPKQGTTVIVSTAYMDEAAKCDRIALMNLGRILKIGTPDELKKPLTGKIYEIRGERLAEMQEALVSELKDAQLFGDRLHVRINNETDLSPDEGMQRLTALVRGKGFDAVIRIVEPSLEDVFVDLLIA